MNAPTPQTTPTRDEAVEAVATAFKRMHSDTCYPSASDGEAKWAAEEIIKAYKAAVDRVNRATDTEIGGIHRSLTSAPAPASGGMDAVAWQTVSDFVDEMLRDWSGGDDCRMGFGVNGATVTKGQFRAVRSALASLSPAATPVQTANCCHCGRIIDTRETTQGGDEFGAELSDGRWTCSPECWDAVVEPAATPVSDAGGDDWMQRQKDRKQREVEIMQEYRWGNLTPLGVANHLKRAGFNIDYAIKASNALAKPASSPAGGDEIARWKRDSELLSAIQDECWDVRFTNSPNADAGDYNVNIEIVGHFMSDPQERVVGENYNENLRAALEQAMTAEPYPPARPIYDEPDEPEDAALSQSTSAGRAE